MRYLLLVFAVLLLIKSGFALNNTSISDIKAKYDKIKTIQGNFTQSQCSELDGICRQFEGKFYISRPYFSRLEVSYPDKQVIVTDSNSILVYLVSKKKVYVQPASSGIDFFKIFDMFLNDTVNYVISNSDSNYTVFEYKKDSLDQNGFFSDLKFFVNCNTQLIDKFSFSDISGNENSYELSDVKLNGKMGNKLFTLEVQKGTEFIKY